MSSKAQGLSLNAVIIAVLVLIVLLVIVGITTGYFKKWGLQFKAATETSCTGSGGRVVEKTAGCSSSEKEGSRFYEDVKEGKMCCLRETCEELGGHCCSGGFPLKQEGAWSCKEKGGNCCSS